MSRPHAPTSAVDVQPAEAVLAAGQADLMALGREARFDPYPGFNRWPLRHGVRLARRAPGLASARAEAARGAAPLDSTAP